VSKTTSFTQQQSYYRRNTWNGKL